MPSIQEAIQKYQSLLAAGKGTPVSPEPVSSPNPPAPIGIGHLGPSRGTFTPGQILGTDVAKHNIIGAPERSRMFPIPSTPPVNKTVQNVTNTTVQESAPLELEVNGVKNPEQTVLNLVQGSGMQITVDGAGGVHFVSLASGDGLIHGDAIWEIDPAFNILRDDFTQGTTTSGQIGQMNWLALGTALTSTYITGAPPHVGALSLQNNTTAASFEQLYPASTAIVPQNTALPLLENPGWKLVWIWKFTTLNPTAFSIASGPAFNMAKKSFYIGLQMLASTSSATARPSIFLGVRFDKDTTAPSINDSTMKFEAVFNALSVTRNNTQGTVVDTGITPTQDVWYRLEIECVSAGVVTMSLNGSTPQSFTISKLTFSSSAQIVAAGNGQASVNSSSSLPFGSGSAITIAGCTGGNAGLNGDHIASEYTIATAAWFPFGSTIASNQQAGTTSITGFPALVPVVSWGNDTEATPVANVALQIDFFSMVWNPGVGGGSGTPDATLPRYF